MKNKTLFFTMFVLAAVLFLLLGVSPSWRRSFSGLLRRFINDESEFSTNYGDIVQRPVVIAAKGFNTEFVKSDTLKVSQHVPMELESWLQDLRKQLLNKVETQNRKFAREEMARSASSTRKKFVRGGGNAGLREEAENESDLTDAPYLLWRELQLRGDNNLVINMMLVNNRRQEQSRGVIVSQILPEGWNLCSAWPNIQVANLEKRELKWLFAEAASRRSWALQVVLTPNEDAEMPLLPEKSTTLRCCLPGGELMQYACMSLP